MRYFGWVFVWAALGALTINLGRDQGEEWGFFFGALCLGWMGYGFWRLTANERDRPGNLGDFY